MAIWDFVKDAGKSVFGKAEAAEPKPATQPEAAAAKPGQDPETTRKVAALKAELRALNLDKDDVHLTLRGDTPVTVTGPAPQPAIRAAQDGLPRIAPSDDVPMDRAPAMPAPALDLSLPPDLTDLRRMERD